MRRNNKALSTIVWILIIIIIVAVVIGAAFILGSSPETVEPQQVTVYIDGVEQTGNYSEMQTLDWGTVAPGFAYTKNFTVQSKTTQPLTLRLLTTEPYGCTQTWQKNNTVLPPSDVAQAALILSLNDTASVGAFSWRLLAVNGTIVQPTPSPSPSPSPSPTPTPTPEPLALECTVQATTGVLNITITNNAGQVTVKLVDALPFTFPFTQGDTLTFMANNATGYVFMQWTFDDGTWDNTNPLKLTNLQGNFTLTAEFIAA